jgi:hypothetical protein
MSGNRGRPAFGSCAATSAALLALGSCAHPQTGAESTRVEPPAARAAHERRISLDLRVAAALTTVVRLRHLEPRTRIRHRIVDRAQLVERVVSQLDSDVPARAVAATEDLYYALGLVDAAFDFRRATVSLLDQELAGLYDPRDKTLYVDTALRGAQSDAAIAHELVHGLQDQHFDLGALTAWRDDGSDARSAVQSLAEGDATSAMLDVQLEQQGRSALDLSDSDLADPPEPRDESAAGVPGVLLRSLLAPYVDGTRFVHRLRRAGGWKAVDAAWRNPPISTRELLEPNSWPDRAPPESIAVPVGPVGGIVPVAYHDVLGQQGLRVVLEEWNGTEVARAAARGWSGDRVAVFAEGDRRAAAVHTRFDTEEAARRALAAFARGLPALPEPVSASGCAERPDRGPIAVVARGRDLVVVAGPFVRGSSPAGAASGCAEAVETAAAMASQ